MIGYAQLSLPKPWTGPNFAVGLPDWFREMNCPVCGGMTKYRLGSYAKYVDIAFCPHISISVDSGATQTSNVQGRVADVLPDMRSGALHDRAGSEGLEKGVSR